MKYAPVIIPTLCRYEHFVRCIESLRKNTWAEFTDIYIGLDYPKKESHREGYLKIREYLEGDFSEFRSFTVFQHKKNLGPRKNTDYLLKNCLALYDRFIYSEDDMEYSPNFLQYMDTALEKYEHDNSVVSVLGYSYPIDWIADSSCTVVKQNFNCSAWGRAFWKSKFNAISRYLHRYGLSRDYAEAYKENRFKSMLEPAIIEYTNMVAYGWASPKSFLNRPTDIAMRIYLAVKGKYAIMPLVSKVRNHGFDGSGLCCQGINYNSGEKFSANNYPFSLQETDKSETIEIIEDTAFDIDANRALFNTFEDADPAALSAALERAEFYSSKSNFYGILLGLKQIIKKVFRRILGLFSRSKN